MTRIKLKLAIVKTGRPQYLIAQELGIHETTLSKFLHGHATLRPSQVARLASILGVAQDVLYGKKL